MSTCHWFQCDRAPVLGKFSVMDEAAKRHEFCSAEHQRLFTWLDMPQPTREKPFCDTPSTMQQIIAALKPAA